MTKAANAALKTNRLKLTGIDFLGIKIPPGIFPVGRVSVSFFVVIALLTLRHNVAAAFSLKNTRPFADAL